MNPLPELHWHPAPLVSALHAAEAMSSGLALVDRAVENALAEPVEELARAIVQAQLPAARFWSHLIPLAHGSGSQRHLAETAVAKTLGRSPATESLAGRLGMHLAALEAAFRRMMPKLGEELALRGVPLRDQWEARGPGLLATVYRLTHESLAVPKADVLLMQPVLGGGGRAHLWYNSVRIEAVLVNPLAPLPEIVRLGWLIAQLNLEVPSLGERVDAARLARAAELALLPAALQAGEEVELCRYDRGNLALALDAFRINVRSAGEMAAALCDWWETYLDSRPDWSVALAALDRMITSLEDASPPARQNPAETTLSHDLP